MKLAAVSSCVIASGLFVTVAATTMAAIDLRDEAYLAPPASLDEAALVEVSE